MSAPGAQPGEAGRGTRQEPSPLWPLPAPRCAGAANERQPPPPQLPPDVQADIAARVLDAAAPGAAAAAAGAGGVATRAAVRLVTRGARDLADGSARRVALPPAQAPGLAAAAPRLRALRELELRFPPGGEGLESAAGGGAALASVADALPLLPPLRSLVVSRAPGAAAAAAASNLESPEDRASEAARVGALEGRFSSLEARLARAEAAAAALVASAGAGASSAAAGAAALVTAAAAAQPGLRALDLRGIDLGAEGSGALADALRAGAWPQLEALSLRGLREPGLSALVTASHLARLSSLSLRAAGASSSGGLLRALAAAPWAPAVTALRLAGCNLGVVDPSSGQIAISGRDLDAFESLKELSLAGSGACDAGAAALAAARLPALRRLSLRRCALVFGPSAVAAAPWARQITDLDLSGNQIANAAVMELARAPLAALRSLDLREASPGGAAAAALTASPWMAGVERLALCGGAPGLAAALAAVPLPALRALHIEGPTEAAAAALAGAPWVAALSELRLSGGAPPAAADALRRCPGYAALEADGKVEVRWGYDGPD